jgi:hypothetical protein
MSAFRLTVFLLKHKQQKRQQTILAITGTEPGSRGLRLLLILIVLILIILKTNLQNWTEPNLKQLQEISNDEHFSMMTLEIFWLRLMR